jgi:hypothetical protein
MTIAAFNAPPGGALGLTAVLQNVVGIRLNTANVPGLNWAIFGKVVVTNPNPNPENVVAELVAPAVLDTTNVTIPAKSSQSISLEGVLATPAGVPPPCVEIKCSSTLATGPIEGLRCIIILPYKPKMERPMEILDTCHSKEDPPAFGSAEA